MYERIITALILIVAVIHLLPISGFFGVDRLAALYKIEIAGSDMEILMRHRAVLLGILGGFFAYAAFRPSLQPIAFVVAFITIASFFYLTLSVGHFNDAIRKVVIADIVAAVSLLGAIVVYMMSSPS